ncbi:MAG: class II aldolase/adducin family protein, partial [Chlamydiia bacterium]|nr:class II aldolase/adducin family protein [Chlamydiia bacterium]
MKQVDLNTIHPKELVSLILSKVYKAGYTTTSGGNISIRDEKNDVYMTPTAVDKGSITAKDISCVKADGSIEGPHKPSSEYPFHLGIFRERDDINAIIHVHSPALVAFSIVAQKPSTMLTPWAKQICTEMGVVSNEVPGSQELGDAISTEFAKGFNAAIMLNHGVVVGGKDMLEAYNRFETLELLAQTVINSAEFGDSIELTESQIKEYNEKTNISFGENTDVNISSDEKTVRDEIVAFMDRANQQKLIFSNVGSISTRLEGNNFVTTPEDKNRWNLEASDLVQIVDGKIEAGKTPSIYTAIDQEIFDANPDVNSIVHSASPNMMAFSLIHQKLDVRTIPESWIFLQDVFQIKFGDQFAGKKVIAETISNGSPLAI